MFVINYGQILHLTFSPDVLYLRQSLRPNFCSLSTNGLPQAVRDAAGEKTYQVFSRVPERELKVMGLVEVIPQGYDDLPEPVRRRIIPICIAAFDQYGNPINPEWFSRGVAPVRRQLVCIARFWLGDPWCVSELAEQTVHRLAMFYGNIVPSFPDRRVLKKANRLGVELNVGDWRKRKYPKLYVALDALDTKVRDQTLADPVQCPAVFERQIMLDSVEDRLEHEGRTEMRLIFQLVRRGYGWQDIAGKVGDPNPDNVKRRFYRWVRKTGSA